MSSTNPAGASWQQLVVERLPTPLKESGIPAEYLVLVPATLIAIVLSYILVIASSGKSTQSKVAVPVSSGGSSYLRSSKHSIGRSPTVLLVGLQDSGKTSLFSSLVYSTVPSTVPSQCESHGQVILKHSSAKPVHLIDLPGHPRLGPLLNDHIDQADGIVICIDAVTASRPSSFSTTRQSDTETITQAADLVHATLTSLAKSRATASSSSAPPSVLILFTRADLSPLLGGSVDADKDEKRRVQLLSRCRTALETELQQRRSGMGLGRRHRSVQVAGVSRVIDTPDSSLPTSATGLFGWIKSLFSSSFSGGKRTEFQDESDQDDHHEQFDYVDTASSANGPAFTFRQLDDTVVCFGQAELALASVGKVRSWSSSSSSSSSVPSQTEMITDGLVDFQNWLVGLQKPE